MTTDNTRDNDLVEDAQDGMAAAMRHLQTSPGKTPTDSERLDVLEELTTADRLTVNTTWKRPVFIMHPAAQYDSLREAADAEIKRRTAAIGREFDDTAREWTEGE